MGNNKITFLINSLSSGGAEKVLSVIATELVKQGFEVEVIFLEQNEFYELPEEVKKTYLSDFNGRESGIRKLLYIPVLAWKLKKYIQQNKIMLIQSHIYRANYVNILAKFLGSNHKAQIVNAGRVSRYQELGLNGKINLWLIKQLYAKADLLISKAIGMQEDMQTLFDFSNQHIVINNPYDIVKIEKLACEKVTEFSFDKDKIYLISVGRLIPLKRNHEFILAIQELDEKVDVIFLGDGKEKDSLVELAKDLGLKHRVHFLGQVKNPYKFIASSDLFVSCSESEGFPNVLVESMICRTAVVSSDCVSGPSEILGDDDYGLLFDVGDKKHLVAKIQKLLNNPLLKQEYINKAKKRSYDFSVEKIVKQYKKVLLDD